MRIIGAIFRFAASLKLAVFVLLSLAVTLAVATFFESAYSAKVAQSLFYKSTWFTILLLVLGLNVAAAAISRYPWKIRHIPFLITHAGIITLLIGSLQTQITGFEGLLSLEEGKGSNQVAINEKELRVLVRKRGYNNVFRVPFFIKPKEGMQYNLFEIGENFKGEIDSFLPWASHEERLVKDQWGRPIVLVGLKNQWVDIEQWLSLDDREKDEVHFGPASIKLEYLNNESELNEFLRKSGIKHILGNIIIQREMGYTEKISVPQGFPKTVTLKDGTKINFLRYLPHALVDGGKLINKSKDPINPAIELTIEFTSGEVELHTIFSKFPDFPTLHGHRESKRGLKIVFEDNELNNYSQNVLSFGVTERGGLLYKIIHRGEMTRRGEVEANKEYETGWMGMKFKVKGYEPKGRMDYKFYSVKPNPSKEIPSAVRVKFNKNGLNRYVWIEEDSKVTTNISGEAVELVYTKKSMQLPFSIHLDDFKVNFDPGTQNPSSFESFVKVVDGDKSFSQRIWMNNPLVYGGYTLYQASYAVVDGEPKISVLQVAKDQGRILKYSGASLISLGIILMFWVRPWLRNREESLLLVKDIKIRKKVKRYDIPNNDNGRDNEAVL